MILTLKSLGIFRRRGKRAGQKQNKPSSLYTGRYSFPSVYLTNATSISNKLDELAAISENLKVTVIAITETWETTKNNINLPGFNCFSSARSGHQGGGVAIYVHESVCAFPIKFELPTSSEFDSAWIYIRPKKLTPL